MIELAVPEPRVFVIVRTTKMGGAGAGAWYCKGNLFTYLLYLQHKIPAVTGRPLLVVEEDATSLDDMLASLPAAYRKDTNFVHLVDGVYSGSEASNVADWWQERVMGSQGRHTFSIFTAIAESPPWNWNGPRLVCGKVEKYARKARDRRPPKQTHATDVPPKQTDVQLYAALCVPPAETPAAPTNSFLLPFKIADSLSLGDYSKELTDRNPTFSPSYREHVLCSDLRPRSTRQHASALRLDPRPRGMDDKGPKEKRLARVLAGRSRTPRRKP
jgi:hypothetical protein